MSLFSFFYDFWIIKPLIYVIKMHMTYDMIYDIKYHVVEKAE